MAIGDVLQILPSGLAGFAPPPAPAGSPIFFTRSGVALAAAVPLNIDLDLSLLGFNDTAVIIEARVIETTKNGTAHLTDSAVMPAICVWNNKNNAVSLGASAFGGATGNPFNSQPQMLTVYPETSDANLRSGGFQPLGATWSAPGGSIARLIVTNPGPVDGDVIVYFAVYKKVA
jgi:hypothetical protein